MLNNERKPLAFISASLHKEDNSFVELVEKLARENGFEPYGTIGRHSAAPTKIWDHILENIPRADCVIMAATPRYSQELIYDRNITKKVISETVHAEAIIAATLKKPLLIFCLEGTDLGSLLPQITQYITLRDSEDAYREEKQKLIKSYFSNSYKKIRENWGKDNTIQIRSSLPSYSYSC